MCIPTYIKKDKASSIASFSSDAVCTVWQQPPVTTRTVLSFPSEAVIINLRNIGKSCLNAFKLFDVISSILKKKMRSAEGVLMSYLFCSASINLWQQGNECSLGSFK